MTYFKILLPLIFLFLATTISAQTSKKTPQIHTLPSGIVKLNIEASSNRVEILKTKGTRISIETNIRLGAGSLPLLEYLIKNGRYELTALVDREKNSLTLSPKKNSKVLLIKGQECSEIVTYKIHIPESVEFVQTLGSNQSSFVAQN